MHYCNYMAFFHHYAPYFLFSKSLERRNSLAFVLVQCRPDDLPVAQFDLTMGFLLERKGVLHPFLVISIGVIFTSMSTTGFLSVGSRHGSLRTTMISTGSMLAITRTLTRK